ncbi:MAG: protein kinase [Candidatus Competibacteraceae bacterium]
MHIPGYQIEHELGQGGMAIVYLALQESLHRHVALKVIKPILTVDEEFAQRFLREGRIIAQLSDPYIVTVYDIGSHDNTYYLSMEYLSGGTLQQRIRDKLSLKEALSIAKAIASALNYAHRRSIIHRDIKPQNILFRDNGTPVLTDFGIAKTLGSNTVMTRTGLSIGTPRYMSPEQIRGQAVDARSDLYSFGVLFYEMLTGNTPYIADDSFALAMMHVTAPTPDLPPALSRFQPILNKLLEKDPQQRFQTGQDFITALDGIERVPTGYFDLTAPFHPSTETAQVPSALSRWRGWKAGVLATALTSAVIAGGYLSLHKPTPPSDSTKTEPFVKTEPPTVAPDTQRQIEELHRQQVEAEHRRQDAEQLLTQARQQQQAGALEESLVRIEQGLRLAPDHAGLLALRQNVNQQLAEVSARKAQEEQQRQAELSARKAQEEQQRQAELSARKAQEEQQRQGELSTQKKAQEEQRLQAELQAEQLLEQAQRSRQEGALEVSLVYIEQGLQALPNYPKLLTLRQEIKAQLTEVQRQEAARRQQEDAARQKAELAERQKAEQARLKAEAEQHRQKADLLLARALDYQRNGAYEASLLQIEQGLQQVANHRRLLALREEVRKQLRLAKATPPVPALPVQPPVVDEAAKTAKLLKDCAAHLQANRLASGRGGNAADCYAQVLKRDRDNAEALAGLEQVADKYADLTAAALQHSDLKAARNALKQLERLGPANPRLGTLREQLAQTEAAAATAKYATHPASTPEPKTPETVRAPASTPPTPTRPATGTASDTAKTKTPESEVIVQDRYTRVSKVETDSNTSLLITHSPQGTLSDQPPVNAESADTQVKARTVEQAWAAIKNSDDSAAVEQFLATYPTSRQATAARAKLKQLKQQQDQPARLVIQADVDDAVVWINGKNVGTTPLETELKPGAYKVRVSQEGHADWRGQVNLASGDESTLKAILPKKLEVAAAKPATPTPAPEVAVTKPATPIPAEPEPPQPRATDTQIAARTPSGSGCLHGNCNDGEGTYHYPDGNQYSGQFRNAKMHGEGTYLYTNRGEKYVGEWRNGVINGQGTYYYRSGNRYQGEWRNGKKSGQGTYTYKDRGDKYVGDFENDQPNGQGTYYYRNGDRYEGEWRNGRKHGQGVLYENGQKIVGEWQNDVKVRVSVEP